ncbi:stage specific activator protein [Apostichopus japonicus]|uniref:Stage specific activator protein n=1 Tax=Stichopus japonicus TaxID=307972 RepID=A0A2G8L2E6_STIJA|nr:stage specific activator protein [Apostichopus japonicus]
MGDEELGKLFIGGVDKNTRPEEFRSLFENKGQIDDIVLMKDATMPDRNRGFGFVKFRDPSSAEELLNDPEPLVLNGKTLDVKACRQRDSQQKQDGAGQPDSPNKIFVGGLPQTVRKH